MQWGDLWAAFALYLVLEGLVPFVNPAGMKEALRRISGLPEPVLRMVGLACMVAGAVLLYFVRGAGGAA
ncbi:MAG: DUF2065 domain-containing protein [Steroidobacteraceae bacterium]